MLTDVGAERAVIAGICKYGEDCYYEICDILKDSTFTFDTNKYIFSCLKHAITKDGVKTVDLASIHSAAKTLGISSIFDRRDVSEHLASIIKYPVSMDNVGKFAAKIRKLEITRIIREGLEKVNEDLLEIKGNESISHILGIPEAAIFDFSSLLNDNNDEAPTSIYDGMVDYLTYLADNPTQYIGISTGYPQYDKCIGGGLRTGVSMIAARSKCGKSFFGANIGRNISDRDIPVLYLDTEMQKENQQIRIAAIINTVEIDDLETGKFGKNTQVRNKVLSAIKEKADKKRPFYYKNISGKPFEEILSIMRRWIVKNVGIEPNGKAKKCVIIYDYMKLMSAEGISADMKEYQLLGFMATGLHNFAIRYDIPILAFMQTNRDGLKDETEAVASGSDRIIWLCINFSIYKKKSPEEMAEDGDDRGNRKLVPVVTRYGEEPQGGYISMNMIGKYGQIVEVNKAKNDFEYVGNKDEEFIV